MAWSPGRVGQGKIKNGRIHVVCFTTCDHRRIATGGGEQSGKQASSQSIPLSIHGYKCNALDELRRSKLERLAGRGKRLSLATNMASITKHHGLDRCHSTGLSNCQERSTCSKMHIVWPDVDDYVPSLLLGKQENATRCGRNCPVLCCTLSL